jgi:hypothetical protein
LYFAINSNPTLKDPVPDIVWTLIILFSFKASQFSPKANFWQEEMNVGIPSIGK